MNEIPFLAIFIYGFTLWFGFYLLARNFSNIGLRYAGLGLVAYAIGLLWAVWVDFAQVNVGADVPIHFLPVVFPSIFWLGATFHLVPDVPVSPFQQKLVAGLVIYVLLTIVLVLQLGPAFGLLIYAIPVVLLVGTVNRVRQIVTSDLPKRPITFFYAATVFFVLGTGMLIVPVSWLSSGFTLLAISLDIIFLGYVVAVLDAYDEGTSLLPDALRSLAGAGLGTLLFGGQVVLVIAISGMSVSLLMLLYGLITSVVVTVTLSDYIQSSLDNSVFGAAASIRSERDELRAVASAVPRMDGSLVLDAMDDSEFTRLTRRALSHYSDLSKLASSPLTSLPVINIRLQDRGHEDNALARANELKRILRESIEQLKPDSEEQFSSTDEWRYYNALHFPYVVGIKPYSSRYYAENLDVEAEEALKWFKTYIPERTLYNWQKTAAELVAQYIRSA